MSMGRHWRLAIRFGLVAVSALVFSGAAGSGSGSAAAGRGQASTFVEVGSRAVPVNSAAAEKLFTCQVGLTPFACYDPNQIRTAYHLNSLINAGYTGAGKTIVILDAYQSPTLISDLNTFDTNYNLPGTSSFFSQVAPDGLTPFNPSDGTMVGWSQEITLDVSWAHAISPGAKIVLDLARSANDADLLSALKYAVDNHLGDVISQSFGEGETCVDPSTLASWHAVNAQAIREGITVLASSGDWGASQQTCDGNSWNKAVSWPAVDPLVTGVGGTELHAAGYCFAVWGCDPKANPVAGTYQGEIAWNEFDSASTGGGYSTIFSEPAYQQGVLPGGTRRSVPDVAYNAAIYHGVLVAYAGSWWLFGGTSCGSPQWAGIVAIADQKAGRDLGFINTALYHIGQAPPHYSSSINDIVSGSNSVVEADAANNPVSVQGFSAGTGWDATTGLGSPIGDQLVTDLGKFVSNGDATAAIAQSMPHGNSHQSGKPGTEKSH